MTYLELFLGFLRVGCFTFGGGYAAIPLIRDVALGYGWLSEDALTYMIAVSESTPGPIMVNLATYVGSSQAGILGAALATLAVVMPSFCIILLILVLLKNVIKHPYVQAILKGMQPCVVGIILATGVHMIQKACFHGSAADWGGILIAVVLTAVLMGAKRIWKKKLTPIQVILLSALLGILIF